MNFVNKLNFYKKCLFKMMWLSHRDRKPAGGVASHQDAVRAVGSEAGLFCIRLRGQCAPQGLH
jgi:hypothetical protein